MKKYLILLSLIALVLVYGCTTPAGIKEKVKDAPIPDDWMDVSLKDIRTGEEFKISDFLGKPILLESFAVWCPTCTRQQKEVKKLHEEIGDDFISISLDTDPNEDEAKVLSHVQRNRFTWRYAIAPIELTRALIDEYSIAFVNAPLAPMALICEDGSSRFLPNGVKSPDDLKEEIARGCASG